MPQIVGVKYPIVQQTPINLNFEIPGDWEVTGVLRPENEVGAGWVDATLSTSTCHHHDYHNENSQKLNMS